MEDEIIIQSAPQDLENKYTRLESTMMEEMGRLSSMSPSRCIFRVHDRLRRVHEDSYTPRIISIGPLHYGTKDAFKAMEEHKMRYLKYFLSRSNLSLMHYIDKIKDQEKKLRTCYVETLEFTSEEFVRIILVDAVFIIEFAYRNWHPKPASLDENDCIFGIPKIRLDVWHDLTLLENQLPFFILEDLFDPDLFLLPSDMLKSDGRLSIMSLSLTLLNTGLMMMGGMLDNLDSIYSDEREVQHFVDLLRKLYIARLTFTMRAEARSGGNRKITTAPSMEQLFRAGVNFKAGSTDCFLYIRFVNGTLEIPKFETYDGTECVVRNLVAFEQGTCKYKYISDYVCMIDQLVDTTRDVELLVEYKILENNLGGGDHELTTVINRLSTGVSYSSKFYYSSLCEDLNNFCGSPWHKRMASLRQNYFNTPWAIVSFVAAVFLLILTVIQTICSIISIS